ncbi:unnamed protein product [Linum trigynum]|uniref:Uncharacterized protein n=1 Tax=Linum trigynum TaxID=586398 RepID=A0AAV2D8Z9_9ROSI
MVKNLQWSRLEATIVRNWRFRHLLCFRLAHVLLEQINMENKVNFLHRRKHKPISDRSNALKNTIWSEISCRQLLGGSPENSGLGIWMQTQHD